MGAAARTNALISVRWAAVLIAVVTFAVFSPTLGYEFLDWDDVANLVTNDAYRGLSGSHLHWMLTTIQGGHWIPVTWLTFGVDYVVWGLNPFGYHLTNVLLHAANAVVFFYLLRRLLRLTGHDGSSLDLGAAVGALLFSLHPLRVESVAWITERRDILSTLLWLLAIVSYLRAVESSGKWADRWKAASVGIYQLAVLAKSIVVTLPIVLLLLDVYPLRRHRDRGARLLLEKMPYLPVTLLGAAMAVYAVRAAGFWTSTEQLPLITRVGVASYSVWIYLVKTMAPAGLSPLYELPPSVHPFEPRFVISFLAVVITTIVLVLARRRCPAGLVCWMAYLIILAPVSGILHNGPQLWADRYSYLSCLPWAALVGGLTCVASETATCRHGRWLVSRVVAVSVALAVVVLPLLTWRQLPVWRDSETLWRHTVAVDPECSVCHYNFGQYLRNSGRPHLAVAEFSQAAALRPALTSVAVYRANRGLAYLAIGSVDIANQELVALQATSPAFAEQVRPAFIIGW